MSFSTKMKMPQSLRELYDIDPSVKAYIDHLDELSTLDPVTSGGSYKILNRRGFDIAFAGHFNDASQQMNGGKRSKRLLVPDISLLLLDMARFGFINNRYGHDAGDTILRYVGRTLARQTRPSDVRARWGGDEFAVLMPRTRYTEAAGVVNRVLGFLWEHRPSTIGEFGFYGGLATYDASTTSGINNFADFFKKADDRLRQARTHSAAGHNYIIGNNGEVVYFTSSPSIGR